MSNSTNLVPQLARLFRYAHNLAQSVFEPLAQVLGFLLGIKNPTYEKYSRYAHYFTQHLVTCSAAHKKYPEGYIFMCRGRDSNSHDLAIEGF